ncbi:MAG: hypothetical protein JWQ72_2964 [Polaromonas sp.]|nr:hypothetical protein [Polaromonas sp.]
MHLIFNPDVFALGLAVGVLGLVLVLSLIISYAYDERTLLMLAGYLVVMAALAWWGERLAMRHELMQLLLLVAGPACTTGLMMWLLKNRHFSRLDAVVMGVAGVATVGLLGFYLVGDAALALLGGGHGLIRGVCIGWCVVLLVALVCLAFDSWDGAGPWKWWLLLGHLAGLVVSMFFLADVADASQAFWPVVLMLLLQLPPIYLCLVWRSRLINEIRLRSASANVTDPLTGLATTPVLVERLMRIMSRSSHQGMHHTHSALYLIQVQNWNGLLNELGPEFNEKLLLEAALRLRRSIGDNDMVARIAGGRFAVIAQGLVNQGEVAAMATRLVVSGLRIDSPLLPGVELQFRVIVRPLNFAPPLALPAAAHEWLAALAGRFGAWPSSHRSRSILVADDDGGKPLASGVAGTPAAASSRL